MMYQLRSSVIIPAFNAENSLPQTLNSIFAQPRLPLEVIVVDDGSTDNTTQIAKRFAPRVTLLTQANAGPAAARNRGVQAATGEFVAFLDSDDYWLPGFIPACEEFLDKYVEAVAVSVGMRFTDINGKQHDYRVVDPHTSNEVICPLLISDFFLFWALNDHIRTGSCMMRRKTLLEAGPQLEKLRISEDLEYWGYLATFGKWGFLPQSLWICDSQRAGARVGWLHKYAMRRQLCPTLAQWQERIMPRLKPEDWIGFKMMRGQVAATFAHNHVLAGQRSIAKQIVAHYGSEMPPVWSATVLRIGQRVGSLGWVLACFVLWFREHQKAAFIRLKILAERHKFSRTPPTTLRRC